MNEEILTKRLFTHYNKHIRPSRGFGDITNVSFYLTMLQLISVTEKSEEMTTSQYITIKWLDPRLTWNPEDFGGITQIRLPSHLFWNPEIALYNNNDGRYDTTVPVNAVLNYSGTVEWLPPAIYKSACQIKVDLFPFDWQNCTMRFRSFTYDKSEIFITSMYNKVVFDREAYRDSGEWTIIHCPMRTNQKPDDPKYQDVSLHLIIQRKPLFYVINIISPCVMISAISVLVFYLPSGSSEKMTMGISVLLGLTVYLLLLAKRVPETSLAVPLIGAYLLFTMITVTLSIIFSVIVLNVYHRSPSTSVMPRWIRLIFVETLPRLLRMQRPISTRHMLLEEAERMEKERTIGNSSSFLLKKSITDENYCKSQKKRLFVRSRSLFRKNNLPRNVASKEDKRRQPIFAKVSVAVNQPKLTDQRKAFRKHNLKSLSENSTSSLSISLENNTKVSGDLKNDRPETCTRSLTDHLPFICDEYDVTQSLLTRVKSESACISSKTFPSDELLTAPLTCGKCNPEKPSLLCADKSCNGRCTDNRVSARGCRSLTFSRSLLRNSLIIHRQNIVRKRRLCKELRHDFPKLQINRRKAKQLEKVSNPVERFSAATEKNDCSCLSMVYKNLRESKVCCKIQTNHQLMENRKTPDPEEGTQMCKNFTKMKEMLETHDSQQSAIVSSSCDATSAGSESISAGSSLSVFVGDTWSTDGNEVGDSKLPRLSSGNVGNFQASTKKSASFDSSSHSSEDVLFAANTVNYITEKMKKDDRSKIVDEDWHFVAAVIDQLLLWIFLIVFIVGSFYFFLKALLNAPPDHPFHGGDPKWATCWEKIEKARYSPTIE